MIKFSKWLWRKAEAATVRDIIAMMDSYYIQPSRPPHDAERHEQAQFQLAMSVYKDGQRFKYMVLDRFDRVYDKDAA